MSYISGLSITPYFPKEGSSFFEELPDQEEKPFFSELSSISFPESEEGSINSVVAHVFLDDFIRKSALEGGSTSHYAHILQQLLTLLSEKEVMNPKIASELQKKLSCYLEFETLIHNTESKQEALETLSQKVWEKAKDLTEGESLLLPGGTHSHAMLYELSKENGFYKLLVVNTGEGIEHHWSETKGKKTKYSPFLVFSKIPESLLFSDGKPIFFEALFAPLFSASNDFPAKAIYDGPLAYLAGYLDRSNLLLQQTITKQRSGTCSWKVFLGYFRSKMEKNEYERAHFYFRLFIFHSAFMQLISSRKEQSFPFPWDKLEYLVELFAKSIMRQKRKKLHIS